MQSLQPPYRNYLPYHNVNLPSILHWSPRLAMSSSSLRLFLFLSHRMELNHSMVILNLGCQYNHFYFIIAQLHLLNHRNLGFALFIAHFFLFLLLLCILLPRHLQNHYFFVLPLLYNHHQLFGDHYDILFY